MLIIVEGSDGSGKTTAVRDLAAALALTHPHDVVKTPHFGIPKKHPLDEYENPLLDYRPGTGHHIICDRHFVGEWVYPEIFGRSTLADRATWIHINAFLASRGAVIVHVDPGDDLIVEWLEARGDDLVNSTMALDAARRFREIFHTDPLLQLPVIAQKNYRDPLAVERVITAAREHEATATVLNAFTTYVGPANPRYLLLGDVRHHLRHDIASIEALTDQRPAFGPYVGLSGHYLLTHLPESIVTTCGIANACDVDDIAPLRAALGYPQTVALGRKAQRALSRASGGSIKTSVPHPQFIKRFHNARGYEYGKTIARALENETPSFDYYEPWSLKGRKINARY